MPFVLPMRRSQVKVLDLWNGSSNDANPIDGAIPPYDYRVRSFDDSSWTSADVVGAPASDGGSMDRFTLNTPAFGGTRVPPNLNVAADAAWPTVTASNTHQNAILRWRFNPGHGPFTNAELLLNVPFFPPSVRVYLNWDGNLNGLSMQYTKSGASTLTGTSNIGTETWANQLIPNAENVLVAYITSTGNWSLGLAWFSMAWRFPDISAASQLQIPVRADMVKAQRVTTGGDHNDDFPGWTSLEYDDSAWPDAALVTYHPSFSDADLDLRWNGLSSGLTLFPDASAPTWRPDPIWPIDNESVEFTGALFRVHFTLPPGEIVRTAFPDPSSYPTVDGTFYLVDDPVGPVEPQMWLNGTLIPTPTHFQDYFAEALIAGQENVLAMLHYNNNGFSTPVADGYGAWVEFYMSVAFYSIRQIRRGGARVQVIG